MQATGWQARHQALPQDGQGHHRRVSAVLVIVTAATIFMGEQLLPTSAPLPADAYPFLVATFIGWIWMHGDEETGRGIDLSADTMQQVADWLEKLSLSPYSSDGIVVRFRGFPS